MHETLAVHPLPHPRFAQHLGAALFEHPGADARLHVLTSSGFEDHRLYAVSMQQVAEQQPRRTRTHNRHLSTL